MTNQFAMSAGPLENDITTIDSAVDAVVGTGTAQPDIARGTVAVFVAVNPVGNPGPLEQDMAVTRRQSKRVARTGPLE